MSDERRRESPAIKEHPGHMPSDPIPSVSADRAVAGASPAETRVPLLIGAGLLALFLVADLAWGGVLTVVEVRLGLALGTGGGHGSVGSVADGAWHLATAFALALPTRRRALWALAPPLSLGLDADHVYGIWLPAPFPRVDHDLLFVAISGVVLGAAGGRLAGCAASGAVLLHIGVDGGSFPLFAPFSPAPVALPHLAEAAFLVVATVLFFVAVGSPRALLSPRYGIPALAVVLAITLLLVFVVPPNAAFNSV